MVHAMVNQSEDHSGNDGGSHNRNDTRDEVYG